MNTPIAIEDMLNEIPVKIENIKDEELIFTMHSGAMYLFYHSQDCCESVSIEDIIGDLNDLIGQPLLMAEEIKSTENPEGVDKGWQDSFTWTFYKFATINGYVTIRWYGESNGYYSESVSLERIES